MKINPAFPAVTVLIMLAVAVAGCSAQKVDEFASIRSKTIAHFRIMHKEKPAGFLSVKASGGGLEIWEKLSLPFGPDGSEKAGYHSVVRYGTEPTFAPVEARAATRVGRHAVMDGKIIFGEKTYTATAADRWDPGKGCEISPPKTYEWKDKPVPGGALLFQSAFIVLAPKLIGNAGEMKIVFVEFPDDIGGGELVNLKEGYLLVREGAKDDGTFFVKVLPGGEESPLMWAKYDAAGKCVSAGSGPIEYIPAELP